MQISSDNIDFSFDTLVFNIIWLRGGTRLQFIDPDNTGKSGIQLAYFELLKIPNCIL